MAIPFAEYQPRRPAEGVLYQIVQQHFETFRAQAASLRDGGPARQRASGVPWWPRPGVSHVVSA